LGAYVGGSGQQHRDAGREHAKKGGNFLKYANNGKKNDERVCKALITLKQDKGVAKNIHS